MSEVTIGAIQRITNDLLSIQNTTLDGYTIGSITPEPGTFTTLTATTTNGGNISGTFNGTFAGGTAINSGCAYCATATSYVSTATLQALPGLTVSLVAGGIYEVAGQVPITTANNAAGVQLALNATNSLTFTSASVAAQTYNGTTLAADNIITAASSDMVSFANTCTLVRFNGTIVVNAAGTLGLSSAQHTSSASTSTIGAGGYLRVTRIS